MDIDLQLWTSPSAGTSLISQSSSLSSGSSFTSVNGRFAVPKVSKESRIIGDDGTEGAELVNLELPRAFELALVGEGTSNVVDGWESCAPLANVVGEVAFWSPPSWSGDSTSCES